MSFASDKFPTFFFGGWGGGDERYWGVAVLKMKCIRSFQQLTVTELGKKLRTETEIVTDVKGHEISLHESNH